MMNDGRESEPTREFRLEGFGLLLGGGLLLAAVVGSFLVGRWYERRSAPPALVGASGSGALEQVAHPEPDADVDRGLTFFDDVEGGQKQLEPGREATPASASSTEEPSGTVRSREPAPAAKTPSMTGEDLPFWVQVFAGRDRHAAEKLVDSLTKEGRNVRLLSEREGSGALYKVQVGGYPTRDEAKSAAKELEKQGYSVWVPPAE